MDLRRRPITPSQFAAPSLSPVQFIATSMHPKSTISRCMSANVSKQRSTEISQQYNLTQPDAQRLSTIRRWHSISDPHTPVTARRWRSIHPDNIVNPPLLRSTSADRAASAENGRTAKVPAPQITQRWSPASPRGLGNITWSPVVRRMPTSQDNWTAPVSQDCQDSKPKDINFTSNSTTNFTTNFRTNSTAKDIPKDISRDIPRDIPKDIPKDNPVNNINLKQAFSVTLTLDPEVRNKPQVMTTDSVRHLNIKSGKSIRRTQSFNTASFHSRTDSNKYPENSIHNNNEVKISPPRPKSILKTSSSKSFLVKPFSPGNSGPNHRVHFGISTVIET